MSKKGKRVRDGSEQAAFDFEATGEHRERNTLINDIRRDVAKWRDNDPHKRLKADIDPDAWDSLHETLPRTFPNPTAARSQSQVNNNNGDELMKVFEI